MKGGDKLKIREVAFRRLTKDNEVPFKFKRFGIESASVNVILIDIGGSQKEKSMLEECEKWLKEQSQIRLLKITKIQAFYQIYMQMMKQAFPVYFVSLLSIDRLQDQPLLAAYRTVFKNNGGLSQIHELAKENLEKIGYIILKQDLKELKKLNFFHQGVKLIATDAETVIKKIEEAIKPLVDLNQMPSTSSLNTEDARNFAQKMKEKVDQGLNVSPKKVIKEDEQAQAWRMKNDTPGVGTYILPKFDNFSGTGIGNKFGNQVRGKPNQSS